MSRPTLFITRDLQVGGPLSQYFERRGYEVIGDSPLSFAALPQPVLIHSDWVFAYSPRSIELLAPRLLKRLQSGDAKIAAIGNGTAAAWRNAQIQPDFIGSGTPQQVAQQFSVLVRLSPKQVPTVTFLQAEASVESIATMLAGTIIAVPFIVYRSVIKSGWTMPACKSVYLTSPMCVRACLPELSRNPATKIYAIGPTTAAEIVRHNLEVYETIPPSAWR